MAFGCKLSTQYASNPTRVVTAIRMTQLVDVICRLLALKVWRLDQAHSELMHKDGGDAFKGEWKYPKDGKARNQCQEDLVTCRAGVRKDPVSGKGVGRRGKEKESVSE